MIGSALFTVIVTVVLLKVDLGKLFAKRDFSSVED